MTKTDGVNEAKDPRGGDDASKQSPARTTRRRFGKAGLAAPVIMTLASRPVWAQGRQCTVSALASFEINQSRPIDLSTCQACSPGYWHHENACWPETQGWFRTDLFYVRFGYTLGTYQNYLTTNQAVDSDRPTYAEIVELLQLPLDAFMPNSGVSLTGGSEQEALYMMLRMTIAAMLNAVHPNVPFALYTTDILASLQSVFPGPVPLQPSRPTATVSELNVVKNQFDGNWSPTDNCMLPNSGTCPGDP